MNAPLLPPQIFIGLAREGEEKERQRRWQNKGVVWCDRGWGGWMVVVRGDRGGWVGLGPAPPPARAAGRMHQRPGDAANGMRSDYESCTFPARVWRVTTTIAGYSLAQGGFRPPPPPLPHPPASTARYPTNLLLWEDGSFVARLPGRNFFFFFRRHKYLDDALSGVTWVFWVFFFPCPINWTKECCC